MIKVAVFGIVASLIAMKIKTIRPEIAILIAVISSILLAMYGLKQMEEILAVFETIRSYTHDLPQGFLHIIVVMFKILLTRHIDRIFVRLLMRNSATVRAHGNDVVPHLQ